MLALERSAGTIGERIAQRLREEEGRLRRQWQRSTPVQHFIVDNLLSPSEITRLYEQRPPLSLLHRKRSLRESKWVGVDLERYDPAIGAHLLAFQEPAVLDIVGAITGVSDIQADPSLYASGISVMVQGDFLNPHIDNSHDGDQQRYRVLNLLFYVSPDWKLENGGNFEIWTSHLKTPTVIESRFNRLVAMVTHDNSWHSVQPVKVDAPRMCLSNYYFSPLSPKNYPYRHVTSFRGRPEELFKRVMLRADSAALNLIGRIVPGLVRRNRHRRR